MMSQLSGIIYENHLMNEFIVYVTSSLMIMKKIFLFSKYVDSSCSYIFKLYFWYQAYVGFQLKLKVRTKLITSSGQYSYVSRVSQYLDHEYKPLWKIYDI